MDVGHAHEPAAAERRLTAGAVAEAQLADHRRGTDLELVPVAEQLDVGEPDRILALDAQLEHGHAAEDRRLAVVAAVHVRARVVHAVGVLPLRRAARAKIAVAGRGQRLAKPLLGRIEPLVGEREAVHRAALSRALSTRAKPAARAGSRVSARTPSASAATAKGDTPPVYSSPIRSRRLSPARKLGPVVE